MKNKIFFALVILLSFPAVAWGLPFYSQTQSMVPGSDTVNNNLGTTSPANLRYNGFFKNISVSGTCTGCTSGGAASSTLLGDTNTFSGTDKFSNPITDGTLSGLIAGNSGLTYAAATSSIGAGTGLTFSGTAGAQVGGANGTYSVNTSQNITTLSNLSTAGTLNNTTSGVLYSTATSTPTVTAPITYSGTLGQFIGGVSGTFGCTTASAGVTGCLSGTDWSTFNNKQPAIALGAGTVNSSAGNVLYATATSTSSLGSEFSYSGTLGQFISGVSGSLTLSTNGTALTKLAQVAANTVLGNNTGATGNVVAFATSTLGIAISDTTGTLLVPRGGTGAVTLTGCLTGNGTGAITGSGTCNTSNATVSSIATNNGLTGGTITTTGTIGLATIAQGVLSNIVNASGVPVSNATSTLFTGTAGQAAYFSGTGSLLGTSTIFTSTASQVGIGSTTPWAKLSVSTMIQQSGAIPLFAVGSTTNDSLFTVSGNGTVNIGPIDPTLTQQPIIIIKNQNASTFLTLGNNSTGSSAQTIIQVGSNANSQLQFSNFGTNYTALSRWGVTLGGWSELLGGIAGNGMAIGTFGATPLVLGTNSAAVMTLTSGGNVGVGTTSPWRSLSITGTVGIDGLTGSAGLQVGILCLSANKEVINESVACVASAARYKQNIKNLTGNLTKVLALQPVSFFWKKDYNGALQNDPNKNGTQYSLIADSVQKVDPNLVSVTLSTTTFEGKTYPPGTVEGLADSNHWTALFVGAFKEIETQVQGILSRLSGDEAKLRNQQKLIDDLTVRVAALEKKK